MLDYDTKFYRMTRQRKIILTVLKNTQIHPTADWIYEKVKKKIPNISLGTVYRNLRILKETGKIRELNYGSSYSRFDGNCSNHYHFVCRDCGAVSDVDFAMDQDLNRQVEKCINAKVEYHRTEFYGKCSSCQNSLVL